MDEAVKIFPTVEELESVNSRVQCAHCKAVFLSSSNLNMHLLKHHKIETKGLSKKSRSCNFYCPVKGCVYHGESEKYFGKLKYLKQHFLKVHAVKRFECRKCKKKFSTETFRNLHLKTCGKLFACFCGVTFNSSEALHTHCKRKGHAKNAAVPKRPEDKTENDKVKIAAKNNERLIYPKLPSDSMQFPIHYIAAIALSELSVSHNRLKAKDVAIQTDSQDSILLVGARNNRLIKKRKSSQQTQTMAGKNKNLKISTETQTNNDYLKSKQKNFHKSPLRKRKKSMETQTKEPTFCKISKGSKVKSAILPDEEGSKVASDRNKWFWNGEKDASLEQKESSVKNELLCINEELNFVKRETDANLNQYNMNRFDINRLCNIETQTEMDNFLTECSDDTSFTLCSTTETQTTDDFDSLLYSHMCTQTSEDVDQLFDFNFVDIETQTAWPDLGD